MMKKSHLLLFISLTFLFFSCDGESVMKGMFWGFNKMMGDGIMPSPEILELGAFERAEVNISKTTADGENENFIEVRLFNGKSEALAFNQENTARMCAEIYAKGYSKIEDFDTINILFVQSDPFDQENVAMTSYIFRVQDILE
ncbi:hypothetical protein [Rhodonellum sp.]|uniref:hypothetical protein n=1 Tax=Rhodonellum sp. TaxID=2231180 RepID=UPI0027217CFD|nr:hypothetical protein [Rhodonellum sp.]MDO9552329.1 hypothetical protein [Rhodonellum sp.]